MSPALLAPAALAALLALVIPVIIHIARRTESLSVDFAALRWLDREARPRQRLQIDERVLLALRLLLLALAALWLAQPVLRGLGDDRRVVAVLPGVAEARVTEIVGEDDRVVWLAPGFPERGGLVPQAAANPASLIRALDAALPPDALLDIVVPAVLDGVDAERPRLSRTVGWHVADPVAPTVAPPAPDEPPALVVRHDAAREGQARYFRAAALAWSEPGTEPAYEATAVGRPLPRNASHLVWLSAAPLPEPILAWVRAGGVAVTAAESPAPIEGDPVVVWRDAAGEPLALERRLGRGRIVGLTRVLEPATLPDLLDPGFPGDLLRILQPPPVPARVVAAEHSPLTGRPTWAERPADLRPWLALLIALMFVVERWMATRPSRAIAP